MGTTMTEDQDQNEEPEDEGQGGEPVEAPTGPTGPIGPYPALAGEDEDPDVVAAADMTDAPAEPITVFLRAAADRLDEERRDGGQPPEEGARFNFSLEVRRR